MHDNDSYEKQETNALRRLMAIRPEIRNYKRGLPDTGLRLGRNDFTDELYVIDQAYSLGNAVYSMNFEFDEKLKVYNSGNGSPLLYTPFPPAVDAVRKIVEDKQISQYAYASGDEKSRRKVAEYLVKNGFITGRKEGININQIIFFNSVTEAFSMVMKVICKEGDVVLFTAPTYGLFAYAPERVGAITRFVPLHEADGWLTNPEELERYIRRINKELVQSAMNDINSPRVVAFVHINPNNPTGKVMNKSHSEHLKRIIDICKENGVFLIDDIIYRDLCYDLKEMACPMATFENAFTNTITLFGTSKSYGLAGTRAGAVFADEIIIRGLRNEIFQQMDSTSLLVSYIMAGTFNNDEIRNKEYESYFADLIKIYIHNWKIVCFLVTGNSGDLDKKTLGRIRRIFGADFKSLSMGGISGISLAGNIVPESGFFVLLDFTELLGKRHMSSKKLLKTEWDIVYYFYEYANVKLLTGSSFAWPCKEQVVARVSFAYAESDLIGMFRQIQLAINGLEG